MGIILTLVRARWFPFALIGVAAAATTVFGWGYWKGYNKADEQSKAAMIRALEDQRKQLLEQAELERSLALATQRKKYEIRKKIAKVPRVGCTLSPECVQWHDAVIVRADPDSAGAND